MGERWVLSGGGGRVQLVGFFCRGCVTGVYALAMNLLACFRSETRLLLVVSLGCLFANLT